MKKPIPHTPLNKIRIVMVRTSHSGNIGAAARAMRVMGLYQLYLVDPKNFPSKEATALASGANDVLENAIVVPTLEEALKDCHLAFATTARPRYVGDPLLTVEEAANSSISLIAESPQTSIAFVFGTERTGLTNEELDLCQHTMTIPTENNYNSLNVAAAIQLVSYEIRQAFLNQTPNFEKEEIKGALATNEDREGFYKQLESILIQTEFLSADEPKNIMKKIRLLFNRRDLTETEIHLLRGILTSISRKLP